MLLSGTDPETYITEYAAGGSFRLQRDLHVISPTGDKSDNRVARRGSFHLLAGDTERHYHEERRCMNLGPNHCRISLPPALRRHFRVWGAEGLHLRGFTT